MANTTHLRHIRHNRLRGLNVVSGRRDKLRNFSEWLTRIDTDLSSTAAANVVTPVPASNSITDTAHGFSTGDGPFEVSAVTTLPAGLLGVTPYFLRVSDVNTYTLHRSREGAFLNTEIAAFTDTGAGAVSVVRGTSQLSVIALMRERGISFEELNAATDIDTV